MRRRRSFRRRFGRRKSSFRRRRRGVRRLRIGYRF